MDLRTLILVLFGGIGPVSSQTILTLEVDQPAKFQVSAGDDIQFSGPSVIGGTPTASGGVSGVYSYQWTPPELLDDPTLSNPTILELTGTTVFTVSVTDGVYPCPIVDQVTVYRDITTGIETQRRANCTIHPNPVSSLLQIVSDADVNSIHISSVSGRSVFRELYHPSKLFHLDLSTLTDGIYLIKIGYLNGGFETHRICKISI
jgi:hypothetical protein